MTPDARTRVPFADRYPLAAFETIADAAWWRQSDFNSQRRKPDFDRTRYDIAVAADKADQVRLDAHKKLFREAVEAHLSALLEEGALTPITGIKGRDVTMATAWNDLVADRPADHRRNRLMSGFERLFVDEFVRMDDERHALRREEGHVPGSHRTPAHDKVVKAWTGICTRMDAGTSGEFERGLAIECEDQKTGDRCEIHFERWKPTLMVRNAQHRLEPALDVATPDLVQADLAVPTGRLLMTDFLRADGFKEGVDFGDREYDKTLSLNTAQGRDARTKAHAQEHQIGYTQTTNTCVAVRRHPKTGMLMVTERWGTDSKGNDLPEDDMGASVVRGWETVGAFSCDMWRVMALDRSSAIARMAAGGCVDAEAALDAYLASDDCYAGNVLQLDIEPGRWRIHAGDDFSSRVDRRRHGIPKGVHVWCLLERVG